MIAAVSERDSDLEQICVLNHVERLDLFGSAASGDQRKETNDPDFPVEFQALPAGAYADAYFGLLEALEMLFEGPVDLVVDSAVRNLFFRQRVEETRTCFMRLEADGGGRRQTARQSAGLGWNHCSQQAAEKLADVYIGGELAVGCAILFASLGRTGGRAAVARCGVYCVA